MTPDQRCAKCEQWLPRDQFARLTTRRRGTQAYCRACANAYWQAWAARRASRPTTAHTTTQETQ